METIVSLTKPKIIKKEDSSAVFEIENLYPGYGITLANALRRTLLSSIPGASATTIKLEGVPHEFSTLEGVIEDVVEIILNIKLVRFKIHGDEAQTLKLEVSGEKEIKAKDIVAPSQVEIINKDAHIATLTDKKAKIDMEIKVEKGLGYVPSEQRQKEKLAIGEIAIDAVFSPIRKVNYEVENMRVGDRTDFNRLRLLIETDGSVTPEEAFKSAVDILVNQFKQLLEPEVKAKKEVVPEVLTMPVEKIEEETEALAKVAPTEKTIDELSLSPRTMNALKGNNILSIEDLVDKTEEELMGIKGLGAKAIKEIRKELGKLGIILKSEAGHEVGLK
jgi:DNA-directed RNA polymerase subunit alpha